MRLYAYIHEKTRTVRIVTKRKKRLGTYVNSLAWELSAAQYLCFFKVVPMKSNIKDALRAAVNLKKHLNIPPENIGKGHQSFVWSRGNWQHIGTMEVKTK